MTHRPAHPAAMNGSEPRRVSLGEAIVTYGLFIFGLLLFIHLAANVAWFPAIVAWAAYFAFGFYLNRVVLRGLIEWHPLYNYVENVAKGKLTFFLLWPVTYPVLFFQLAVDKVL